MLQFRRTFETEKHQLKELNSRLGQYLSRTKQLEQDNACLITEINKLKQQKSLEWENQYKAEMRELRRMVGQLSFEKSQAEMDRERLWREFQMMQAMCCEETGARKDIGGELKGCEKQLQQAHKTNESLEERLFQLENECICMEDAHRQEIAHLQSQVHSRVVPIVTQRYHGPPAVSMEEVQEYARSVSEGWIDTFEMYQKRVDEMEESIRADQARMDDLQMEKMLYVSELDKLRAEAGNQNQIQMHLEEQRMHMQENFRADVNEYQVTIEQLEQEHRMLANSMAERVREHQELLQVKMDLGMEVAAYRALLEAERIDVKEVHMRANQHQRERIIDIKMPSQHYTPSMSTSTRQDQRRHLDVRYMEPTSSVRRSPVPSHFRSTSPSRVIPISVTGRAAHQSPADRRDMVAFTKASQAAAVASATSKPAVITSVTSKPAAVAPATSKPAAVAPATSKPAAVASATSKPVAQSADKWSQDLPKKVTEERSVRTKEVSQHQVKDQFSPITAPTADSRSVRVVSPPTMSPRENTEEENKMKERDVGPTKRDVTVIGMSSMSEREVEREERGNVYGPKSIEASSEKKVLDSVSMEEIIEKVMRPAGFDAKVSSSGDSTITYHVEKTEQEDGTIKTQIILESKVEEELDLSKDDVLEELLSTGVKKVSLEDIKGTPTGSMIENLLSLGIGGDLGNKSVNVEIIEEPVDSQSDEEYEFEDEDEDEVRSMPRFSQPSSAFFQIEELENVPLGGKHHESGADVMKTSVTSVGRNSSVHVQEESRDTDSPYFSLDQESQEYFVSTPDDNASDPEEGGISSYGHYGVVDDLSDERYYQEVGLSANKILEDDESGGYTFTVGDHSFVRDSFPEITEEEIHVSPSVQESMLGFLKEESMHPKEQLRGALEQLQDSLPVSLKEELSILTDSKNPHNLAVDVKKVQQSSDNGTMTIVAELNVSRSLEEDSGGAAGGYGMRAPGYQDITVSEGFTSSGESMTEVTEKHIKLGPSEKSFTFQMDVNNGQAQSSSPVEEGQFTTGRAEFGQVLQSQVTDPPLKVIHEKRVATVYLESSNDL